MWDHSGPVLDTPTSFAPFAYVHTLVSPVDSMHLFLLDEDWRYLDQLGVQDGARRTHWLEALFDFDWREEDDVRRIVLVSLRARSEPIDLGREVELWCRCRQALWDTALDLVDWWVLIDGFTASVAENTTEPASWGGLDTIQAASTG